MQKTSSALDSSDFFIVVFIVIIFVTGAVVLFRFVRNNKKERALRQAQDDSDLRKK